MNKAFIKVLLFAFVVAGLATVLVYRLVSVGPGDASKPATAQLFVAAHNLGVGALVRDADLTLAPWAGPVPPGSFTKKEDVVGRGVMSSIYQGEPILDTRLASKGAGGGLAATIPPGMRAVGVRVNDIIGVSGFVVPGMRVDVLISGTAPGSAANIGKESKTLLQNIEVLSAGPNIQKDNEGKPISVPVVNLLVTPDQAEILTLASSETTIQLVLRNPLDKETVKTPGTALASLFSGAKTVQAEAPKPRLVRAVRVVAAKPLPEKQPWIVEVIQGNASQGNSRNSVKFSEERQ